MDQNYVDERNLGDVRWDNERYEIFNSFLSDFVEPYANQLIISGDFIEWIQYGVDAVRHSLSSLVRLFQLPSKGVKIVYVVGNHDIDFCQLSLSGTPIELVYPRLHLDIDGTSFHVEHGHFYDPSIKTWPAAASFFARWAGKALDRVGPRFEDALGEFKALILRQRFDTTGQRGVGQKERDTYWQAGCDLARGEHDYVVFGHTHDSCLVELDIEGKTLKNAFYVNTGDWQVHTDFAFFKDRTMRVFDWESQREAAIEFASA